MHHTKDKNIICTIPAYRFDIFGPMDLVEEVALGYGIQNLEPILSPSQTLGQTNPISLEIQITKIRLWLALGISKL